MVSAEKVEIIEVTEFWVLSFNQNRKLQNLGKRNLLQILTAVVTFCIYKREGEAVLCFVIFNIKSHLIISLKFLKLFRRYEDFLVQY